jgi:hypothetical protein
VKRFLSLTKAFRAIPQPTLNESTSYKHSLIGVIVGSTVGSLAFLFIVGVSVYLLRHRLRHNRRVTLERKSNPFMVGIPSLSESVQVAGPRDSFPSLRVGSKSSRQLNAGSQIPPAILQSPVPQPPFIDGLASINQARNSRLIQAHSTSTFDSVAPGDTRDDLTTRELVRILNTRLQPERWREDEMLPVYAKSEVRSQGGER